MPTVPPAAPSGLSTPAEIEALGDQLTACADALHQRVIESIKQHKGAPISDADQAVARGLIDDELLLRERANALYADAATVVVKSLGQPQQHVMALTVAAAEKIRNIGYLGQAVSLAASLLTLGAAAATGQPVAIIGALDNVRRHVGWVEAFSPPAPA